VKTPSTRQRFINPAERAIAAERRQERAPHQADGFTPAGQVAASLPLFAPPSIPQSMDSIMVDNPSLSAVLTRADIAIGVLLGFHIGADRAITIAEIAAQLYPREVAEGRAPVRQIKESISRLLVQAHMLIGSMRTPPYGIYLVSTAEELAEERRKTSEHALSWIARWKIFDPDHRHARELLGQLELELGKK